MDDAVTSGSASALRGSGTASATGGGAGGSPCEREVRAAEAESTAVHENGDERA